MSMFRMPQSLLMVVMEPIRWSSMERQLKTNLSSPNSTSQVQEGSSTLQGLSGLRLIARVVKMISTF